MTNLNSYPNWISFSKKRSSGDIAWGYEINLNGSTLIPTMFSRLEYQESTSQCDMLCEPTGYKIENNYPGSKTTLTAYSYGYYLKNPLSYKNRNTKAGTDIPTWERTGSNYKGETKKTDEIKSYENPSYHLKRLLWPLDVYGNPTLERGYYNLYIGRIDPVPNWGLGSGGVVKVTQTLYLAGTKLYVSDLAQFKNPAIGNTYVKIFSYTDSDENNTYDEGEETGDYEVCKYTAKSSDSGAGYLTISRNNPDNIWNPSNAVAMYIDAGYDVNHIPVTTKQYFFNSGDSIVDVINKYSEELGMIAYTKYKKDSIGVWREYFYWIPQYRIQETKGNYLGLPTNITQITSSYSGLKGQPGLSAEFGLDQSFNAVWVESCRIKDSAWFYGYATKNPSTPTDAEIPRTLMFRDDGLLPDPAANDYTVSTTPESNFGPPMDGGVSYGTAAENRECQRIVEAKANQLLKYSNYRILTYEAEFKGVYFELLQRIQFIGFAQIPSDVMRITSIEYNYPPVSDGGMTCKITCAKAEDLQKSGKIQSVIDEIQQNYERLKQSISSDSGDLQKIGVVISTYQNNTMATYQLRSNGLILKTRSYGLRKIS